MNQRLLEELAHQHVADLQHRPRRDAAAGAPGQPLAAAASCAAGESPLIRAISSASGQPRPSLRERTGWILVSLGLRMAATPRPVR